ncbi:hypothetical protein BCR43DRAFT_489831 [Syncephalastrum racemosum]|uniref:Uncharacterized protein n=1 Tax=Syncephalastrum racemosum TaxID=13706 RepID=A0A1X2HET8_SYNRA|nr:hypothetical protein BCR43DRAFT_489831 [Syncephalastrum racemosum]
MLALTTGSRHHLDMRGSIFGSHDCCVYTRHCSAIARTLLLAFMCYATTLAFAETDKDEKYKGAARHIRKEDSAPYISSFGLVMLFEKQMLFGWESPDHDGHLEAT